MIILDLTSAAGGLPLYLNADMVIGFQYTDATAHWPACTSVWTNETDVPWRVMETPEQIIAQIPKTNT
jgi:hypothetical protein